MREGERKSYQQSPVLRSLHKVIGERWRRKEALPVMHCAPPPLNYDN